MNGASRAVTTSPGDAHMYLSNIHATRMPKVFAVTVRDAKKAASSQSLRHLSGLQAQNATKEPSNGATRKRIRNSADSAASSQKHSQRAAQCVAPVCSKRHRRQEQRKGLRGFSVTQTYYTVVGGARTQAEVSVSRGGVQAEAEAKVLQQSVARFTRPDRP